MNESHSTSPPTALDKPSPATPIAQRLAQFVCDSSAANMPPAVLELAKSRLLDALATSIAARGLPVPTVAQAFAAHSSGKASIIGSTQRVAAIDAAFVNATLVNGCTHDDFLAKSHAGAAAVPAALACAEDNGASGLALLEGIVLGYELCSRAYLGGPSMLPRFRASGVAGAVGAAAAAAKVMGLDPTETAHALGLSTMFASGFGEGFLSGTMDVKLNVGWACRSGVSAAQLALCGATASPTVFEGRSGFFEAFAHTAEHAGEAVRALGAPYLIEATVYKERPMCIFVQTPVQLALDLRAELGFDAKQIEAVRIRAPLATLTNPGYQNIAPFSGPLQARISARFTVAAALLGRPVETYKYFDHFEDDAEVLALSQRIELLPPEGDADRVWVEVQCGERRYATQGVEMDHLRPTLDKVVAKYQRLTQALPTQWSQELLATVMGIDRAPNVHVLAALLRNF